jgi:hypothetical protein
MRLLAAFALVVALGCREPSIEVSGAWEGSAHLIIDGEEKDVPLRWDLKQSEGTLGGEIAWDNFRREITSASVVGPKVRIESTTTKDKITFEGLFKKDTIEGRFAIRYSVDPEPFPGSFSVTRRE